MAKAIWKYELEIKDLQIIRVPHHAVFLSTHIQNGNLCLWAEINLPCVDWYEEERILAIYGTGNEIPDNPGKHIGTVIMGEFVWHVYDLGEG